MNSQVHAKSAPPQYPKILIFVQEGFRWRLKATTTNAKSLWQAAATFYACYPGVTVDQIKAKFETPESVGMTAGDYLPSTFHSALSIFC